MKCRLFLLLTMCTVCLHAQTWISLTDSNVNARDVEIEILTSNVNQYVFNVTINGFYKNDIIIGDTAYSKLYINKHETLGEIGCPELPVVNQLLGIPKGTYGKVTVSNITWKNFNGYTVYPFQRDLFESETAIEFSKNTDVYGSTSHFPTEAYSFGSISDWGGIKIQNLALCPFRYLPSTSQLHVMKEFTVTVDFIEVDNIDYKETNTEIFVDNEFMPLMLSNYSDALIDSYRIASYSLADNNVEDVQKYNFLIISAPQYKNDPLLAQYLHSKAKRGFACKVVGTDETGNTPRMIKNYIKSQQANGVRYVLFIGDDEDIPMYDWPCEVHYSDNYHPTLYTLSDYWYGCMGDDTDFIAEMAIGRFCVSNVSELHNMINKHLLYSSPNNLSNDWTKKCILISDQEDAQYESSFQACLDSIRTCQYKTSPEFIAQHGADTIFGGNLATNSSVVNQINQGVGLVAYRGHGDVTGWSNKWSTDSIAFNSTYVSQLTCPVIPPVVLSFACLTAKFSYPSDCLMESFTTSNIAAVAFFGSTIEASHSVCNNLSQTFFKQIYDNGVYRIGDINLTAQVQAVTSSYTVIEGIMERNAASFLWGGDPTLELWTDTPQYFSSEDIEVIQNKDSVTVTVADSMKCGISLCSMEDLGLSYFQKVEDVSSYTFVGVDVPCYINVNKHNYLPYTFNENVIVNSKTIDNKSALVGNNITIGETTITNGGTLTIKAQNEVTLNAGFECKKGGILEIK